MLFIPALQSNEESIKYSRFEKKLQNRLRDLYRKLNSKLNKLGLIYASRIEIGDIIESLIKDINKKIVISSQLYYVYAENIFIDPNFQVLFPHPQNAPEVEIGFNDFGEDCIHKIVFRVDIIKREKRFVLDNFTIIIVSTRELPES